MRSATLLLLMSFYLNAFTQNQDSLIKYSHLVYGDTLIDGKNLGQAQGTGFFVHWNDSTYLVTSKHTLSGCGDGNVKENIYPSTMRVWAISQSNVLGLPINNAIIKDTATCEHFVLDADVITYPISKNYLIDNPLSYIDQYIGRIPGRATQLIFFGFPRSKRNERFAPAQVASRFQSTNFILDSFMITRINQNIHVDKFNYYIKILDTVLNEETIGFSGSPVFLKDAINGNMVFCGVLCAINSRENSLYVVKPEYLFGDIKVK